MGLKNKNKRGWIRMIEVFAAILIVSGIILIVIGQNRDEEGSISSKIYSAEISILREIQLNNTIRDEIIGISLPVEDENFGIVAPLTKAKIEENIPSYLECAGKICSTENPSENPCLSADLPEKAIYAESVIISANLTTYSPKILKLFCWEK